MEKGFSNWEIDVAVKNFYSLITTSNFSFSSEMSLV